MLRVILIDLLLFSLPFLVYAGYVVLFRGASAQAAFNDAPVLWLLASGFVLLFIGMVALVSFQGGDPSASYHPPVYEDGVVKPGHID